MKLTDEQKEDLYQDYQANLTFERYRLAMEVKHGDCPADGPCLVDPEIGHTTAF